jgi:hypothetical protein
LGRPRHSRCSEAGSGACRTVLDGIPLAWTGYILLIDGIVFMLRGSSWATNRREFVFLALVSVPLWVVFEGYNLPSKTGTSTCPKISSSATPGAWAFATISPGLPDS